MHRLLVSLRACSTQHTLCSEPEEPGKACLRSGSSRAQLRPAHSAQSAQQSPPSCSGVRRSNTSGLVQQAEGQGHLPAAATAAMAQQGATPEPTTGDEAVSLLLAELQSMTGAAPSQCAPPAAAAANLEQQQGRAAAQGAWIRGGPTSTELGALGNIGLCYASADEEPEAGVQAQLAGAAAGAPASQQAPPAAGEAEVQEQPAEAGAAAEQQATHAAAEAEAAGHAPAALSEQAAREQAAHAEAEAAAGMG